MQGVFVSRCFKPECEASAVVHLAMYFSYTLAGVGSQLVK